MAINHTHPSFSELSSHEANSSGSILAASQTNVNSSDHGNSTFSLLSTSTHIPSPPKATHTSMFQESERHQGALNHVARAKQFDPLMSPRGGPRRDLDEHTMVHHALTHVVHHRHSSSFFNVLFGWDEEGEVGGQVNGLQDLGGRILSGGLQAVKE